MKLGEKKIPEALYKEIHRSLPIFRVEVIAVDGRKRFLMIRRKYNPRAGEWAFPGGRVLKNELVHGAAKRKLFEEAGMQGTFIRQVGFYELIEKEGRYEDDSAHTPVVVTLVNVEGSTDAVALDDNAVEYRWFEHIEPNIHPHLTEMLTRAGFSEQG